MRKHRDIHLIPILFEFLTHTYTKAIQTALSKKNLIHHQQTDFTGLPLSLIRKATLN
jgi:hypothetical protein